MRGYKSRSPDFIASNDKEDNKFALKIIGNTLKDSITNSMDIKI
jgi:hypothetical protein